MVSRLVAFVVVEQDVALCVYYGDTQVFVEVILQVPFQGLVPQAVRSLREFLMQAFVVVLQLHVQQVYLVSLFALVLVGQEASCKQQKQRDDR